MYLDCDSFMVYDGSAGFPFRSSVHFIHAGLFQPKFE